MRTAIDDIGKSMHFLLLAHVLQSSFLRVPMLSLYSSDVDIVIHRWTGELALAKDLLSLLTVITSTALQV